MSRGLAAEAGVESDVVLRAVCYKSDSGVAGSVLCRAPLRVASGRAARRPAARDDHINRAGAASGAAARQSPGRVRTPLVPPSVSLRGRRAALRVASPRERPRAGSPAPCDTIDREERGLRQRLRRRHVVVPCKIQPDSQNGPVAADSGDRGRDDGRAEGGTSSAVQTECAAS